MREYINHSYQSSSPAVSIPIKRTIIFRGLLALQVPLLALSGQGSLRSMMPAVSEKRDFEGHYLQALSWVTERGKQIDEKLYILIRCVDLNVFYLHSLLYRL